MDTQEVEEELYAAEPFGSEKEFLKKAEFNCKRRNSYKGDTPLNIVRETIRGYR